MTEVKHTATIDAPCSECGPRVVVGKFNRECCAAFDGPGACPECTSAFWKWFSESTAKLIDQ